jgi:membrane protease YdiL (CAAX protease family)
LKDAARLLAYLAATVLLGAAIAPPLFWSAQWLGQHGVLVFLQHYDFESFFHRALLLSALLLLWPWLRSLRLKRLADLGLQKNNRALRDAFAGFIIAAIPLLCCGVILVALNFYRVRHAIPYGSIPALVVSAAVVPLIEEALFRGLILGVLLRTKATVFAIIATSALFSIIHFLKAPDTTTSPAAVTWYSGLTSVANAFWQFHEPLLVVAGFTTLFLIACILADARIKTRSLWLPIGLHSGWILASGIFSKVARRGGDAMPWIGKNLLVGIVPLTIALVSWALLRGWLKHVGTRKT